MPELPDVATFADYLKATALHTPIESVSVLEDMVLAGVSASTLRSRLPGSQIDSVRRHGKLLFAALSEGGFLMLHFGMTGELDYYKDEESEPAYTCVVLRFEDGYHLAYVSRRKLGRVSLVESAEDYIAGEELGPDALECNFQRFDDALFAGRKSVKSALMDQHAIAGIGNVYADEILFQAGVWPKKKTSEFDRDARKRLFHTTQRVLKTTIRHKADPGEYPRTYLTSRRGDGEQCPKCGARLRSIKVNGRRGWYCPAHQQ